MRKTLPKTKLAKKYTPTFRVQIVHLFICDISGNNGVYIKNRVVDEPVSTIHIVHPEPPP